MVDKMMKVKNQINILKNIILELQNKLIFINIEHQLPEQDGYYECLDIENMFECENDERILFVFTCNFKDNLWRTNVTHWREMTTDSAKFISKSMERRHKAIDGEK